MPSRWIIAALAGLALLCWPPSAGAVFPGKNGRIVFSLFGDLASMRPDGSDVRPITSGDHGDGAPALSADGRKVAFHRYDLLRDRHLGIFVVELGTGNVRAVPGTGTGDCCPAFAPDGRSVVFARSRPVGADRVLRTVRLDGSKARRLESTYGASDPSFVPDGKRILFVRDGDMYLVRPDGTEQRRLTSNGSSAHPSLAPNGRRIVFTKYAGMYDVFVLRLRDRRVRRLTRDEFQERSPSFSPNGRRIVFNRIESEQGDDSGEGTWMIQAAGTYEHRIREESVGALDWQTLPR